MKFILCKPYQVDKMIETMSNQKLLIGTSKGLVVYERTKEGWQHQANHFLGFPVSIVYNDERTNTWWACLTHRHWGQKLHWSQDEGQTWSQVRMPRFPEGAELRKGKRATVKKIWCLQQAGADKPNGLWLGTEPGGLFYSNDNGQTFNLVESLWQHPSRMNQNQWFGAGRDEPFIHSIVVDPRDSNHVYIAVSCAGVFETKDNGQSWTPRNKGLIAAYLPNPHVEVGHDPHRLIVCKTYPDVLWQQNHCGIFRSTNGGLFWENVTDKQGLAAYGFALAIDHNDPLQAYVIPASSDAMRVAPNLALTVCHTKDGGQSWQPLRNGLPQKNCFDIVFRHAMDKQGQTLAFGTTTGNVYISENGGINWGILTQCLARVECVVFV